MLRNPFNVKKANERKAITVSNLGLNSKERAVEFGLEYSSANFEMGSLKLSFDLNKGCWNSGSIFKVLLKYLLLLVNINDKISIYNYFKKKRKTKL